MKTIKLFLFALLAFTASAQTVPPPITGLNNVRFDKEPPLITDITGMDFLFFDDGTPNDRLVRASVGSIISGTGYWTKTGDDIRNNNTGHVEAKLQNTKEFRILDASNNVVALIDHTGSLGIDNNMSLEPNKFVGSGDGNAKLQLINIGGGSWRWDIWSPAFYKANYFSSATDRWIPDWGSVTSRIDATVGDYVPYSGASASLNMGAFDIKAYIYRDSSDYPVIDENGTGGFNGIKVRNTDNAFESNITDQELTSNQNFNMPDYSGTPMMEINDNAPDITGRVYLNRLKNPAMETVLIASTNNVTIYNTLGDPLTITGPTVATGAANSILPNTSGVLVNTINSTPPADTGDVSLNTDNIPQGSTNKYFSNLTGDITSVAAATTYNNVVPAAKGGAGTVSGLLKANGSGTVSAAVVRVDYAPYPTGTASSNMFFRGDDTWGSFAGTVRTTSLSTDGTAGSTAVITNASLVAAAMFQLQNQITALTPLSASAVLDFGLTAGGATTDLTVTVTGAALGKVVNLGVPNASTATNSSYSAWVSAADTVTVRFLVTGITGKDPVSGTFTVQVSK